MALGEERAAPNHSFSATAPWLTAPFAILYGFKLSTRCLTRLLKYFHWRVSLNGQSAPSRFQITSGWEELFKGRLQGQEASRERDRKRNNERKQIRLTRCISFSLPHQSVLNEHSVVSRPGQDRGCGSSLFPKSLQPCCLRHGLYRFMSYAGISIRLAERGLVITHRGTALMEAGRRQELLSFPSWRNSLSLEPFIRPCSLDI